MPPHGAADWDNSPHCLTFHRKLGRAETFYTVFKTRPYARNVRRGRSFHGTGREYDGCVYDAVVRSQRGFLGNLRGPTHLGIGDGRTAGPADVVETVFRRLVLHLGAETALHRLAGVVGVLEEDRNALLLEERLHALGLFHVEVCRGDILVQDKIPGIDLFKLLLYFMYTEVRQRLHAEKPFEIVSWLTVIYGRDGARPSQL